ncbi:MAG: isoprenylcysteine carboxylmethyltransferase family protein [Candidatus Omnitrophota bacterium]
MKMMERMRRWFKLRFAITYPFGLFLLLYCSPTHRSFVVGMGFIMAGLLWRVWANGYAIKTEKLTTSGPYAFMRHPLYFGTMLVAIGFMVMLRTSLAGFCFIVIMLLVYYRTMKNEERALTEKYGDKYLRYKSKVPALFPAFFPYPEGEKWAFSIRRVIENTEYKLFFWVINIAIIFRLKGYFFIEHATFSAKIWLLIALFFIFAAVDITGEIVKWRRKRVAAKMHRQ